MVIHYLKKARNVFEIGKKKYFLISYFRFLFVIVNIRDKIVFFHPFLTLKQDNFVNFYSIILEKSFSQGSSFVRTLMERSRFQIIMKFGSEKNVLRGLTNLTSCAELNNGTIILLPGMSQSPRDSTPMGSLITQYLYLALEHYT
jgi:hypothetical protein